MSLYFVDSSALVKRYVEEQGSAWMRLVAGDANNRLIIARITSVEVLSVLARRQREGNWTAEGLSQVVDTFRYDLDTQYQVAEFDRNTAETAGTLVMRHPLRAYDSIQLASALRLQEALSQTHADDLILLSADERLLEVAHAEGLAVDNPGRHP